MSLAETLLNWYDDAARDLPWRVAPKDRKHGIKPNPYHVWLSEIMLQQTTVAAIKKYYDSFLLRWPDVKALANAHDDDVMAEWAGLGYYSRARNLLKTARIIAYERQGQFPAHESDLLNLPGIGPYTAAAIASIAFDQKANVVDGNVERVMSRLFAVATPLPESKPALKAHAAGLLPEARYGDYAQALMDLGATICKPKTPNCTSCPLSGACEAVKTGDPARYPLKAPKAPKPIRYGIAYVAVNAAGEMLIEKRGEKGLLAQMMAFPTTEWSEAPEPNPPFAAEWITLPEKIEHVFTHFKLILDIHLTRVTQAVTPNRGRFVTVQSDGLPSVMRKVYMKSINFTDI